MPEGNNFEKFFKVKDEQTGKKIVYITADKNCMKYAHMLQTLISEMKEVKCCIYTKKVYEDNMSKASSDNLIIFIGENNISKPTIQLMQYSDNKNKKFGIRYGWRGTRAVLWSESIFWKFGIKKDFYKYYENTYSQFQKALVPYNAKKGVAEVAVLLGFGFIGVGKIFDEIINGNKLKKAQYNACLMEFIKNSLPNFIEER